MSKRSTLIGLTTVFLAAATAGAQGTVIYACYVPGGSIYRIKVPGGKQECDSRTHVEFSWNDQGLKGDKGDPGAIGALEHVTGGTLTGEKQFTVTCPAGKFAVSGGFDIQGSVTASYMSNSLGDKTGTNAWTIKQSSGGPLSGQAFVYCA